MTGILLGFLVTLSFRRFFRNVSLAFNVIGLSLLITGILTQWTLGIENNETRYFGVRRKEYINVLGSILNADATNDIPRGTPLSHFEYAQTPSSPRRVQKKKDSFFYLTQNLKRRSKYRYYDDDEDSKSEMVF